MKIARYLAHGQISYGAVEGDMVKQLSASPFEEFTITDHVHPLSEVKLLAPCVPTKILAIGLNYSSHLHDRPGPTEPMVFYKTPTSLIGPDDTIIRPKDTERLDEEAELVVVIKDRCRNVPAEEAMQHVLGYTCGNDVSARDWQSEDRNWWRAKSADTFSPAGPYIVTDLDPSNVRVSARINGKEVQSESTRYLIFDIPAIVAYTSRYVTLEPGDMIYTGTPGEPGEMKDGDVCEIEIEGIGILRNPIKLEQ
ncbi:MAG: fumarylacetoacetate hydrolase family protein [Chloroflexi bacterium]|nr:fumarylacetoacetate hydrolase family protein [Chloroflexota bacterium]MCH8224613.1 fumarylacetoacetate hydrolase family protein [Chloroflexota bacterium]